MFFSPGDFGTHLQLRNTKLLTFKLLQKVESLSKTNTSQLNVISFNKFGLRCSDFFSILILNTAWNTTAGEQSITCSISIQSTMMMTIWKMKNEMKEEYMK